MLHLYRCCRLSSMRKILIIAFVLMLSNLSAQEEAQKAFSEGVAHLKANEFIEAEKDFKIALKEGKTQDGLKMSNVYMGFAMNGQRKFAEAVTFFTEAITIDSLDPKTYMDRGLAFAYSGDNKSAVKDFKHVLTLDNIGTQAEAAYYWLGRVASAEMDNALAIEYYSKLLELVPTDAEAYFLRGTAKSNLFDHEGAIKDFDSALKYKPDYMEAYANRGVSKINLVPVNVKLDKNLKCLDDPCSDLLKAKELGDTAVDDMIYLYCKKCK